MLRSPAGWFFALAVVASFYVGRYVPATWTVEQITLDTYVNADGRRAYTAASKQVVIPKAVALDEAELSPGRLDELNRAGRSPELREQYVRTVSADGQESYLLLRAMRHWRWWSMLPAAVAIGLCWMTREPLPALLGGIVCGALLLGEYDLTDSALLPRLMTAEAATVLFLYLWLLGWLMGVWARTGAAQAFADFMAARFVRGPRSAKLVAWGLGVIFFQGGTVSTVLVGSTVKPLADREKVSHEELSYIVDSTASPIASILAFNAWPAYVQAFIFVAGVPFLATEHDRIAFFFKCVPLSFYSMLAVLFTFLLSVDRTPFVGRRMRAAIQRVRTTGELDHPEAEPLSARELQTSYVPPGYRAHVAEFFLPLLALIGLAVGTFIVLGSPKVTWAFAAAIVVASVMALLRGMRLKELIEGYGYGLKGVVLGSVVLLLAVTIGNISKDAGGGIFLVELLSGKVPFWLLPLMLQLLTMLISFSTGTSWGTYAVAFPLAMPLAWAVAQMVGLAHPEFYMMVCFAAVMNGSVYGDQCSPISDTTVLSAMCTGCDLMDHVRTQMPQATLAAAIAGAGWTVCAALAA